MSTNSKDVAKLIRISILNWAKENDVELKVQSLQDSKGNDFIHIYVDGIIVIYILHNRHVYISPDIFGGDEESDMEVTGFELEQGYKISDKLIEVIEKILN